TKRIGVEVYLDDNNDNLVYISQSGSVAVVPGKLSNSTSSGGKDADWKNGMELSVRKAGEKERTKDTKKYGIEVYQDGNNGNLIYISETGDIAVVPAKWTKSYPADAKDPEWKAAMDLGVRKAGEKEFTKETTRFGVEVYQDENIGSAIFLSQTG